MTINNDLRAKIETAIATTEAKLYDMEFTNEGGIDYFRIYIKSPEGVNLALCEEVSRLVSPLIDVYEPIKGKYFFEVSSPGIERSLKTPNHYANSIGERVKLTLVDKKKIFGEVISFDGENGVLKIKNGENIEEYPIKDILKARTYFEWTK